MNTTWKAVIVIFVLCLALGATIGYYGADKILPKQTSYTRSIETNETAR